VSTVGLRTIYQHSCPST